MPAEILKRIPLIGTVATRLEEKRMQRDLDKLVKTTSDRLIEEVTAHGNEISHPFSHIRRFLATYEREEDHYGVLVTENMTRMGDTFTVKIFQGPTFGSDRSVTLLKQQASPEYYDIFEYEGLANTGELLAFLQDFNKTLTKQA